MADNFAKKKNRHRDEKTSEFTYGKWVQKKKIKKTQFRKPKQKVDIEWKLKTLKSDQITGIYSGVRWKDFGFIDVEWEEKGYFVIDRNKNGAYDGDSVIANIQMFRWKPEAIVVEVIKRAERSIVGEVQIVKKKSASWGDFAFVIPKNWAFWNDIFISGSDLLEAKNWDIVWVELLSYHGKNPSGKVVEILGKKGDNLSVDSYILEAGFSKKFSKDFIKNIEKNLEEKDKTKPKEISRRKDFRKLFTFTIDSEDARDLDDAISIKKKENGSYLLYVHIADVAHYVEESSKLDKEAYKRSTSVYLADRVIPMLPEVLSNHLCSLNTASEKFSLTCEILLDAEWQLVKSTMHESIIHSDYRLTYKEVDDIVNKKMSTWDVLFCEKEASAKLIETLNLAEELKQKITIQKNITWVLNFDFKETKIILDENKKIVEIKEYPKYDSNKMIEQFMVMANEAVGRKFASFPFLYRIHEAPLDEDRSKLQDALWLFGIDFTLEKFDTKEIWELLEIIQSGNFSKNPDFQAKDRALSSGQKKFLEKMVLRTLSKAIYSEENKWHFWLGLKFYSHFTSPIRRYPDLQIHRIIKEKLQWKLTDSRQIHYEKLLSSVAIQTSEQERKAEKLEYRVRDYYICDYYKESVGKKYKASVDSVLPYWVFVQLEDTAEGFLELIPKHGQGKWFVYDEKLMKFSHPELETGINLWDEIYVELQEVDMELLRMNFGLVTM